jgi:glucose-6-phosphate 1-dehydrogenase
VSGVLSRMGPCGLVIFGVTGDLAQSRLVPAVYDLLNRGLLPGEFSVVGFGRRPWSDVEFAQAAATWVREHARTPFRTDTWNRFVEGMRFVSGEFDDEQAFRQLRQTLDTLDETRGTGGNFAFYLSTPPRFFADLLEQLKTHCLTDSRSNSWRRVVVEKPFGHDRASARELSRIVSGVFAPSDVFRIDHYLGKETVQNILAVRFANTIFEPIWSRAYVDHVQITMAEDFGIGGRAGYYDGVGAARDVLQNHLLQLLALTAMEEPSTYEPEALAAEKLKVLESVSLPDDLRLHTARGRYSPGRHDGRPVSGYLEETGVDATSRTETYAAAQLYVDNRRWAGVPFYLRTGKWLPRRVTEVALIFQRAPHVPFAAHDVARLGQDALVMRIQPDEGVTLRFGSKVPDTPMEIRDVDMAFSYRDSFSDPSPEAHERLILDLLLGDDNLFPRETEVEQSWRILDPLEESWATGGAPSPYPPGSWGPVESDQMLARDGRSWRRP